MAYLAKKHVQQKCLIYNSQQQKKTWICATMRKLAFMQGKSQNKSISLDAFLVLKCSVSQLTEGFPAHFLALPPQTTCLKEITR